MKKEMTSVDIAAVVSELDELRGAKFDKFYQYGDDKIRVKMRDYDRGRLDLIVETGDVKRLHLTEDPEEAPERPPNLPMLMRKRLSSGELVSAEQYDFDRIVEIRGEREDEYTMVAELFGDGNFSFLDSDGTVLRSLDTVRLKTRTVAPGEEYGFPPSRVSPLELTYDGFVELMEESDTDFVRTLASQLNFGGLYAEEICARAGVDKETSIDDATDDDYTALYDAMVDVFEPLVDGELSPHVVYDDGPVDVLPFELAKYEGDDKEYFDSFNEALDDYFASVEEEEDEDDGGGVEEKIRKQEAIIRQQEEAIDEFEDEEDELREKAETLYANYGVVDELLRTVREARGEGYSWDEIRDKLEEGDEKGIESARAASRVTDGSVYVELDGSEIRLDIDEGVEANASRLYNEAKEVAEKREGAIEAKAEREDELERLRQGGDDGDDTDSTDETTFKPRGDMWYDRFRWFRTSDGFLVIGGRNADQNEEIYKKYMEPSDIFFHSQAHGGPITVLKTTEPDEPARDVDVPESSMEEAAQFAVSYSSVWEAGQYAGDVYSASPDQVSKTPESGEYIEKGSVVVRGERNYFRDVPVGVAVGFRLDEEAGVVGGPPSAIEGQADYYVELEPGRYSQNDVAKKVYRRFRDRFDEKIVRKLASPDRVQKFLPAAGSRIKD